MVQEEEFHGDQDACREALADATSRYAELMNGSSTMQDMRARLAGQDNFAGESQNLSHSARLDDSLFGDEPWSGAALQHQKRGKAGDDGAFDFGIGKGMRKGSAPGTPQSASLQSVASSSRSRALTEGSLENAAVGSLANVKKEIRDPHCRTGTQHPSMQPDAPETPRRAKVEAETQSTPPPSATRPLKVAKKTQDLISKARAALDKNKLALTNDAIWQGKIRRLSIDAALKSLGSCATQLLTVAGVPEAESLGDEITCFCAFLDIKFEAIAQFRQNPLSLLSVPSPLAIEQFDALLSMDVPFLSGLLLHVAAECLKSGIETEGKAEEAASLFFGLAAVADIDQPLNCSIIYQAASKGAGGKTPELAQTVAANFQHQLLCLWYDRLSKVKPVEKFRMVVEAAAKPFWLNLNFS